MIVIDFENKTARYRRKAIIDSVMFAAKQLMPRIKKPVYINIRTIRKLTEKQGVYGDVLDEGDREFTIRIDVSIPLEDMISTVLHEMVHVHQYLTGRMKQKWGDEIIFEKKVFEAEMDYDSRPWEIEAHNKEKELKVKYYGQKRY